VRVRKMRQKEEETEGDNGTKREGVNERQKEGGERKR